VAEFDFLFWYTLLLVTGMFVCLAFEVAETAIVISATLMLLLFAGAVDTGEAFRGFANEGVLAVGFLFVVAAGLNAAGVFSGVGVLLFGKERGYPRAKLTRFLWPVAGLSAFVNNTPLVALLIPVVKSWCRQHNFPSSKLLIPLSFATVLGGLCTLIGTSTNLVVHGLLRERGYQGFSFFELGAVGVPMAVVGILSISLVFHRLLPKRKEVGERLGDEIREFVVEMKVNDLYPRVGKTIEEAGLRHLKGLFLFQIERDGYGIAPVSPEERINVGDRLFFTGVPSTIVELQKSKGLDIVKDARFDLKNYDSSELKTYEVVISSSSALIGRSVRESNFRRTFDAVILAIHRSGERVDRKIGDIQLRAGDTLLILAGQEFLQKWYHSREFSLVSASQEVPSKKRSQTVLAIVTTITMVLAVTLNLVPMVLASGAAAIFLILSRCLTLREAFAGIDLGVMVSIVGSLGIARAIENAGVAQFLATTFVSISAEHNVLLVLAVFYFSTVALTEIVTNNAAAATMFPIALAIAAQMGENYLPFVYATAMGASAGFATPIGYQTNLMVQGPGGYRFVDYLKIGIPLDIVVGVTSILMIQYLFL
jgi:di/tricarboxylate transporter